MYRIASPYFLSARTSAAVLHDKPQREDFNDLYHLFLAKIVRLPIDPALTKTEEKRLVDLFLELNEYKRKIERSG